MSTAETERLKELLRSNPNIDERSITEGIELTEKIRKLLRDCSIKPQVADLSKRMRVVGSPGQRLSIYLGTH